MRAASDAAYESTVYCLPVSPVSDEPLDGASDARI
jgi:hypothetical protein